MSNLSYTSGTSDQPLIGITIGDMLDQTTEKFPDNEALVSCHQNIRYTYRQFNKKVNEVTENQQVDASDSTAAVVAVFAEQQVRRDDFCALS